MYTLSTIYMESNKTESTTYDDIAKKLELSLLERDKVILLLLICHFLRWDHVIWCQIGT